LCYHEQGGILFSQEVCNPYEKRQTGIEQILARNITLLKDVSTNPVPPKVVARYERGMAKDDLRPRVAILTLGCKVNYSETEALAENFQQAGYVLVDPEGLDTPDVFIVNTCTVTHVAGRKSRQMLRRAKRDNPQALVVATGCHVYTSRAEVEGIGAVDLVVGKAEEERMVELVSERLQYELSYRPEPSPLLFAGGLGSLEGSAFKGVYRTRVMVKIQDGCNAGCAFCIVPTARGGPRSVSIAEVIEGVKRKIEAGYQEIILTGVHLGKYRAMAPEGNSDERPVRLRALLEALLAEVAIPRLRITSLEPQDYDPTLLELWQQNKNLNRHFHLALQAGCDATLARMRRGYNTEKFARIVEQIRRELPDASITTDIIVGFPGETEAEFEATLKFTEQMGFAKLHVFPFSPREGTLAASMPDQVADGTKKERGERLRLLSDELSGRWRSRFIGEVRPVLWEHPAPESTLALWSGLTDNYLRVYTHAEENLHNRITSVRLQGLAGRGDAEGMYGEIFS
jgi:threonylcarbamoyladenosine tRNA methylthiotransferase MtaB